MTRILKNQTANVEQNDNHTILESISGYEIFYFKERSTDFRLRFSIDMEGMGKCGVVFRSDIEANGHYISLDLRNGQTQARVWGENADAGIEDSFHYKIIQYNHFSCDAADRHDVEVVAFGGYIELSVNRKIVLRYVDTDYMSQDFIGLYVESARICISDVTLQNLDGPEEEDHQVI